MGPATAGGVLIQAGPEFAASPQGRTPTGPGLLDWVFLVLAVIAVAFVVVLCARYFLHPGEEGRDHIKRRVLRDDMGRGG